MDHTLVGSVVQKKIIKGVIFNKTFIEYRPLYKINGLYGLKSHLYRMAGYMYLSVRIYAG